MTAFGGDQFVGRPGGLNPDAVQRVAESARIGYEQLRSGLLVPQTMMRGASNHASAAGAGTTAMSEASFGSFVPTANSARPPSWFFYDREAHAVPGFRTEWAIRVKTARNAVSPGGNWIFGLWETTSIGGAGGAGGLTQAMAGAIKLGPRVTLTPYAQGFYESAWVGEGDAAFNWDDGDFLMLAVNTSAATAVNSYTTYTLELLRRWRPLGA